MNPDEKTMKEMDFLLSNKKQISNWYIGNQQIVEIDKK